MRAWLADKLLIWSFRLDPERFLDPTSDINAKVPAKYEPRLECARFEQEARRTAPMN